MNRDDTLRLLEKEIGVLTRRIRRVIAERAGAVHPQLASASYMILSWLVDSGPVRSSAIAEAFGTDKGAISRQLQHLLDLGLVDKVPDPEDGRATLVSPSEDAVRRLRDMRAHRREWVNQRLSGWSEHDLEEFARTLARYNEALGGD